MALSNDESRLISTLQLDLLKLRPDDERNDRYYRGTQHVEMLGLAVPPELRGFEFPLAWPRITVDSVEQRLDVKSLMLPGAAREDEALREGWDANNLDSESSLCHKDALIYSRSFVTVGANEEDKDHPLIMVESPRHLTCRIDTRHRRIESALRIYFDGDGRTELGTLYTKDQTIRLEKNVYGQWREAARTPNPIGKVPIVMFVNRRRAGLWVGESEMSDVMRPTDMAARALMNLQLALETHSVPQRWALGVSKGDFVGPDGNPLPVWEAYFSGIWANANKDAKVGQFAASDLSNFNSVIEMLAQQMSAVTGLPARYFGQNPANPASEGAINADESRMVKNAERKQRDFGDCWAWVMALYHRFRTGDWLDGNRMKVEWHSAGTPTEAQRADAIQKLNGGTPVLSREGSWDELGWNEARKDRERDYFTQEAEDPVLDRLTRELSSNDPNAQTAPNVPADAANSVG